jgi:hypothetical protein
MEPGIYLMIGKDYDHVNCACGVLWDELNIAYLERRDKNYQWIYDYGIDLTHPLEIANAINYGYEEVNSLNSILIIKTFNPYVIDNFRVNKPEDLKKILIADENGIHHTMNDFQIEMVWSAYQVGIERLSEILYTRGIW